jgi:hypothetical protein
MARTLAHTPRDGSGSRVQTGVSRSEGRRAVARCAPRDANRARQSGPPRGPPPAPRPCGAGPQLAASRATSRAVELRGCGAQQHVVNPDIACRKDALVHHMQSCNPSSNCIAAVWSPHTCLILLTVCSAPYTPHRHLPPVPAVLAPQSAPPCAQRGGAVMLLYWWWGWGQGRHQRARHQSSGSTVAVAASPSPEPGPRLRAAAGMASGGRAAHWHGPHRRAGGPDWAKSGDRPVHQPRLPAPRPAGGGVGWGWGNRLNHIGTSWNGSIDRVMV